MRLESFKENKSVKYVSYYYTNRKTFWWCIGQLPTPASHLWLTTGRTKMDSYSHAKLASPRPASVSVHG